MLSSSSYPFLRDMSYTEIDKPQRNNEHFHDYTIDPEGQHLKKQKRWSILEKVNSKWSFCGFRHGSFSHDMHTCKSLLSCTMLALFVVLLLAVLRGLLSDNPSRTEPRNFDVIVVGGGVAGSVVGGLLARSGLDVLVLEAGGAGGSGFRPWDSTDQNPGSATVSGDGGDRGDNYAGGGDGCDDLSVRVPLLWPSALTSTTTSCTWQGLGKETEVVVGRGLGGSGLFGSGVYLRASEGDVRRWNVTGWTWQRCLDAYRATEHFVTGKSGPGGAAEARYPFHGYSNGSLVTARLVPGRDALVTAFVAAAASLNVSYTADFNGPRGRAGVGRFDFNIAQGLRDSAVSRYLSPMLSWATSAKESRLEVRLLSSVTRVLIAPAMASFLPRAVGVEYLASSAGVPTKIRTAYLKASAGSAVVLSAGALLTPPILMRSGIGPRAVLEAAAVPVVVDLPGVGQGLQDHPMVEMVFGIGADLAATIPSAYDLAASWQRYWQRVKRARTQPGNGAGEGDFSQSFGVFSDPGVSAGAFLASPYSDNRGADPDILLTLFPSVAACRTCRKAPGSLAEGSDDEGGAGGYEGEHAGSRRRRVLVTVSLLRPERRGQVVLNSSHPEAVPVVSWGSLTDSDVGRMIWAVGKVREIMQVMRGVVEEVLPGAESGERALLHWIRKEVRTSWNFVGTSRMGNEPHDASRHTDLRGPAVVDAALRVRGVDNLRVVDASVMPDVPSGSVHASVVMLAAEAAALLSTRRGPGSESRSADSQSDSQLGRARIE